MEETLEYFRQWKMKKNRHHLKETAGLCVVLDYKAEKRNAVKLEGKRVSGR